MNVAVFDIGLSICMLHDCFTGFGKADEAVEIYSPGTPERAGN